MAAAAVVAVAAAVVVAEADINPDSISIQRMIRSIPDHPFTNLSRNFISKSYPWF
jgi:hypothetical protein